MIFGPIFKDFFELNFFLELNEGILKSKRQNSTEGVYILLSILFLMLKNVLDLIQY